MASDREWILQAPAKELARAIRERRVSAEEIVSAHLVQIDAVNPSINALVQRDPSALDRARLADSAVAAGHPLGPLHGVPFTVKDVLETAGLVAAVGIEERREYVPKRDATVVARMRGAGAILLGKTNTPPYGGGGETDNPVYGRTNLPHDLERTPGGSSGGEAALIAAGGSPLGLGSDSGGSLRLPAHYCGVATLKPTSGRVPNGGFFPPFGPVFDSRTVIGPIARSAADLALVLPLLCGPDGRDSAIAPVPLGDPGEVDVAGMRVALYVEDGVSQATDEIAESVRAAAEVLERAGAHVEECRPPRLEESYKITFEYWQRRERTGKQVEENMQAWDRFRHAMLGFMESHDLIVCPVSDTTAPRHGKVGPLTFGFTIPYSLTGSPVAVVRAGTSAEGLPIGVQLAAASWREDVALSAALRVESALGSWPIPGVR